MATGILAMLAKPKGGKGMSSEDEGPPSSKPGGGGSEVGEALMDMFDALKGGDSHGAELAFRRAKAACDDSYEEESPDEMGEEKDDLDL